VKLLQLTIILVLLTFCVSGQTQNNIWYFGQFAGLDFNKSPAVSLTDGRINTSEGCASISDKNGKLLFYTDGITLWNKKHLVMKNGNDLLGEESSTQSAIIVNNPYNDKFFYVFTCGAFGGDINYSVVNILGDAGLGEVVSLNNLLLKSSTEKLTAVRHSNGKDIWVVGHQSQSNKFYTWLINEDGVSSTPVISAVGTLQVGGASTNVGALKASFDGLNLVSAANANEVGFVEIFKFDGSSGIISAPQKLTGFNGNNTIPYGVEFSPNGKLLYVSEYNAVAPGNLYQVKLPITSGLVKDNATILSSLVAIGTLQLAPNGKIYLSQRDNGALHAINFPNKEGTASGFAINALSLSGKKSKLGLPAFNLISNDSLSFSVTGLCASDTSMFKLISFVPNYDGFLWDFDDPSSEVANSSEEKNPFHKFSKPGVYRIGVTVFLYGIPKIYTQKVTIFPAVTTKPTIVADNAALCDTGKVNITAAGATGGQKYNWYDESKTLIEQNSGSLKTPSILKSTIFYASITNGECEGELQPIEIQMNKPLITITVTDTIINVGESVTLTGGGGGSYSWSPTIYLSNTNSETTISTPSLNTTYTLTITNEFGCTATKSIRVILIPTIFIPNTFTPNSDGVNDLWVIKELIGLPNQLQIYNRLGAMVYSAKNYDNTWNGTYKGKDLPAGTYYYTINLKKTVTSGYIAIIR
jgi:gliding motility-associated-like protein